jgi:hypothetical protein
MICVPGQPMLTLVDEKELAARKHLRVPAESSAPSIAVSSAPSIAVE